MRTASLIMLSGLFVQLTHADEIRHATFPNVMLGTWAETAEQCAAKDKSRTGALSRCRRQVGEVAMGASTHRGNRSRLVGAGQHGG
jgi:hypothetical protein